LLATTAQAQTRYSASPGATLRRHLETLAANPNSVQALSDAGRAALDMGDGAAALGFFTRAHQLAPTNPRVKLGLAAATARSDRPQNALFLFQQAQAMGMPAGEIAAERGLAYDLLGQPAAAQQDYVAALRYRDDPEVRRRLAVSLAITGQQAAALTVIGDQIRRADRGGLRTRALVLALSGDAAGATEAARTTMPPGAHSAIAPFFQRLANLPAGQMASAAHLGRFPTGSGYNATAGGRAASYPGALAFAGVTTAQPVALAARLPVAASSDPRRRPGSARLTRREARRAAAARETRMLARSSSPRPAAGDAARDTIDRWDLAGRGRPRATPSRTAQPQRTAGVTARPPLAPSGTGRTGVAAPLGSVAVMPVAGSLATAAPDTAPSISVAATMLASPVARPTLPTVAPALTSTFRLLRRRTRAARCDCRIRSSRFAAVFRLRHRCRLRPVLLPLNWPAPHRRRRSPARRSRLSTWPHNPASG